VDRITAPLRRITGSLGDVGRRISGLGESIRNLSDRSGLPILAGAFGNVGSAVGGLVKRVGAIGLAIAGVAAAGVASLVPLIQSFVDTTGAIGDAAARTGASRERIQELGFAAQMAGSSSEELNGALQKMNITIANAKGGSKELQAMFKGLNISFKNANGTAKTTDELFDTVANRISRIKDPSLQAKAAITIFGESATKLLPLLRGGTAGIDEMSKRARELGIVISDSAVQSGEGFGDVLDEITLALKGVGNTIAAAVVPTLSVLGSQLTENIIKYRPQIQAFAEAFAENLPRYLEQAKTALQGVWDTVRPLAGALGTLADNIGPLSLAFKVAGGLAVAYLIPSLVAVTTSLYGLGVALATTPIGWFIAGIAAIAAGATLIYQNWDSIATFFSDRFNKVKDAFKTGLIDGVIEMWNQFNPAGLIMDSVNGVIKFLTGIDIGSIIKNKVSGVLPEWAGGSPAPDQNYTAVPEGGPIAAGLASAKAAITVDFKNMPTGTNVETRATGGSNIKTNQGYSMMRQDQ
jgi:phage-related minor tail protein